MTQILENVEVLQADADPDADLEDRALTIDTTTFSSKTAKLKYTHLKLG